MESTAADAPILIGYDGSETARHAIRAAAELLGSRPAVVVTVWDPTTGYDVGTMTDDVSLALIDQDEAEEVDDELKSQAHLAAREGAELATSLGLQAEQLVIADEGSVADVIVDLAKKRSAAAIVVGSKGHRGFLARLEGSTSKGVIKQAPCPVVVVHGD